MKGTEGIEGIHQVAKIEEGTKTCKLILLRIIILNLDLLSILIFDFLNQNVFCLTAFLKTSLHTFGEEFINMHMLDYEDLKLSTNPEN